LQGGFFLMLPQLSPNALSKGVSFNIKDIAIETRDQIGDDQGIVAIKAGMQLPARTGDRPG
jgi:hypothetical protein